MKPSTTRHIPTNNATIGIKNHAPTRKLPIKNIVYWAMVKTNNSVKQNIGATDGTLKQRIYAQKLSFSHINYSTYIIFIHTHLAPKEHEHLTYHYLGSTRIITCLQQDVKMPSLPPWETRNYHSPITKHPAKQKIRNIVQMLTRKQTYTFTFWTIHIISPHHHYQPYQYHLLH